MKSSLSTFLRLAGTSCFAAALALAVMASAPATARACDDEAQACEGAAGCGSEHMGDQAAAAGCAGEEKKAGACPCAGEDGKAGACACAGEDKKAGSCASGKDGNCACAGAAAATAPDAKAETKADAGGAHQRAFIDPATGALVEPTDEEAAESEPAPAPRGATPSRQIAQPGGGVMAAFPKDRASNAVATLDEAGKPHTDCGHDAAE